MRSYINFQFATLRKKVGPYIIIALSLLVSGAIAILTAKSMNKDGFTSLNSVSTFFKFFPFLFSVLFSALVITHIFKEGETDGSELIVVAKPLTRSQIVFGKFILSLVYVFAYQVIMLIGYILFTQFDSYATSSQRIKWALSLFVGGIIVQIIATSIIVMLASVLGKIGTVVISILFAAVLPILSYILVPLGKGWRAGLSQEQYQAKAVVNIEANDGKYVQEDASSIYQAVTENGKKNYQTAYKDSQWYDNIAYVDIWYHWGRFYSMFMPTDTSDTAIVNWEMTNSNPGGIVTTTNNQGAWRVMVNVNYKETVESINQTINSMIAARFDDFKNWYATPSNKDTFDKAPMLNRVAFIANIMRDESILTTSQADYRSIGWNWHTNDYDTPSKTYVAASAIMNKLNVPNADNLYVATAESEKEIQKTLDEFNLADSNTSLLNFAAKDFIPTGAVVGIWSVIGLAMCGAALYIYSRRDFK